MRKARALSGSEMIKTDMEKLIALPEKLRNAWINDTLCIVDKKRIVRYLAEDIALNMDGSEIQIGIRFKGGLTESISIPRPLMIYEKVSTDPVIVEYIREASKKYTCDEIADRLNNAGKKTGKGLAFTKFSVRNIQNRYKITPLTEYLRGAGYLSTKDKAKQLGIRTSTLIRHIANGNFTGVFIKTSISGDYMFEP